MLGLKSNSSHMTFNNIKFTISIKCCLHIFFPPSSAHTHFPCYLVKKTRQGCVVGPLLISLLHANRSCLYSCLKSTFFVLAMGSKWEIKATVCSSPWIQYWERESESLFYPWPVPFMSLLAYLIPCPSRWEHAGPITCWEQDAWEVDQQLSAPTPRPLFRTLPMPRGN